jgi:hypothetical protein
VPNLYTAQLSRDAYSRFAKKALQTIICLAEIWEMVPWIYVNSITNGGKCEREHGIEIRAQWEKVSGRSGLQRVLLRKNVTHSLQVVLNHVSCGPSAWDVSPAVPKQIPKPLRNRRVGNRKQVVVPVGQQEFMNRPQVGEWLLQCHHLPQVS